LSNVRVKRSMLNGKVRCPPSKSYTHRAVAVASLAYGRSVINNPLIARDTKATIDGCRRLGSFVCLDNNMNRIIVHGRHEFTMGYRVINAENSGTTIRILASMASLVKEGNTMLYGDASLNRRPMQPLLDALKHLGVWCRSLADGTPPLLVKWGRYKEGVEQV
jgi:5-enolpyruvylshikimate-3-phosphate synthase